MSKVKQILSEAASKLGQTRSQPMHLLLIKNNNQPHQTQNIQQCVHSLHQVQYRLPHSRNEL